MKLDELIANLDRDNWRSDHPFSDEISKAAEVIMHPYARYDERQLAVKAWIFRHQPCVFGQAAAKGNGLYIAMVTEEMLDKGEAYVREWLALEIRTWKQWALEGRGRHGLLVVFASPKLHYAAPDQALKRLSKHLRSMFVEVKETDVAGNDVCLEWLYLRRPAEAGFVKFRVILDYFAAAGDKRWWHDHRFPGGVAFTLNSLGHMVRSKEWYEKLANPTEWAARLAMLTISNAYDHPQYGKATHLVDLKNGESFKNHKCPFANPESLPTRLKNKDWTTYSGSHHTDHSVRHEFFDQHEGPDRERGDYLMDFVYLAGAPDGENAELTNGVAVSDAEVVRELGSPDTWRRRTPAGLRAAPRPRDADKQIKQALRVIKRWLED